MKEVINFKGHWLYLETNPSPKSDLVELTVGISKPPNKWFKKLLFGVRDAWYDKSKSLRIYRCDISEYTGVWVRECIEKYIEEEKVKVATLEKFSRKDLNIFLTLEKENQNEKA